MPTCVARKMACRMPGRPYWAVPVVGGPDHLARQRHWMSRQPNVFDDAPWRLGSDRTHWTLVNHLVNEAVLHGLGR